ncbi:MAG: TRAP transporter substrate-binding protein DctP [Synergistetes bacterium]|nr:TRAP transporter substrate-binding protein DctP [Synergistota bacterium]
MRGKAAVLRCLVVFAILLSLGGFAFAAETKTLIGASCFPLKSPLGKYGIVSWAEKVEAMTGGRLKIRLHEPGEIVPGTEVLDAVRKGVVDLGMNTPAWQKGEFPAGDLFYTLPGGVFDFHDLFVWMYSGEGIKLQQEMYKGAIVAFPLGLTPPEEIWSTKPVKTLEDIKGLKIRAAGLSMELWKALGASVVLLPGGEVLPALRRGLIDATEFAYPSMDYALGLHEVAKYLFDPPIHMGSNMFQLAINPKVWESLSPDLREIIKSAAIAATIEGYAKAWVESAEAFEKIKQAGVQMTKLSVEDQKKAKEIAFKILEEKSKEDEYFKKVWESQKRFLQKIRPFYEFSKFDI